MLDHRSIIVCLSSNLVTILGLISLNQAAIWAGLLAAITTVVWNVINSYFRIKERKENVNRTNK